jgi:hypothetical protein
MIRPLLAALILASAAATARAAAMSCTPNPELDAKAFALWVTPETNPDATPCSARVVPVSCSVTDAGETRTYSSTDGRYVVVLRSADGGVAVTLKLTGAAGVGRGTVQLATFPFQRVFYRGIGADAVTVDDQGTPRAVGNVMLIPAQNLTPASAASCPAN